MSAFTFVAGWLLTALGGLIAHRVMVKRIDAEIRDEDHGIN